MFQHALIQPRQQKLGTQLLVEPVPGSSRRQLPADQTVGLLDSVDVDIALFMGQIRRACQQHREGDSGKRAPPPPPASSQGHGRS